MAVDTLVGQPFPLVARNEFSLSATFENIDTAGKATYHGQEWSCRVGASAPASTTIPGMAGEQTEVTCRMSHGHDLVQRGGVLHPGSDALTSRRDKDSMKTEVRDGRGINGA